jgi:hypothetical protein
MPKQPNIPPTAEAASDAPEPVSPDLSPGYAAAAADEACEADAAEWAEALIADLADEPKPDD